MKKYISLFLLAILGIFSCEKNVEIDIDEIDPMIVMNGLLKADSTVEIFLSRTRHILDNKDINNIADAEVRISDMNGNAASLIYDSRKLYSNDQFTVDRGKEYLVSASAQGFNDVEAVCVIPEPVPIRRIDTSSTRTEWGEKTVLFDIIIDDPPDETNYYRLSMVAKVNVQYWEIYQRLDTVYVDPEKDTVVVALVNDTIEYVVPRYENIWIESEDLALENWDYSSNAVIFSDKLFNGKQYSFNGSFYTWFMYDEADTSTVYIQLASIDEHYYKYISTREDHYYAKDDPFAVPVVVHNNIQDGLGILGGMSISVDSLKYKSLRNPWDEPWYYY